MVKSAAITKRVKEWQQLITKLGIEQVEESLRKATQRPQSFIEAFKQFGLDPQKVVHRELLCTILADVVFGRKKAGRKTGSASWHSARLLQLALKDETIRAEHPNISDAEAGKKLAGPGATAEVIRQRLPAARKQLQQVRQFFGAPRSPPAKGTSAAPDGGLLGSVKLIDSLFSLQQAARKRK
jgi:hypothetical protein